MATTLFDIIRGWVEQEDYWTLYVHGHGDFTATLQPVGGQFGITFVFDDIGQERTPDAIKPKSVPDRRWLQWNYSPGGKTRGTYFQLIPREAALKLDFQVDGRRVPEKVFLGAAQAHPPTIPLATDLADSLSSPVLEGPFRPAAEGFYLRHHRRKVGTVRPQIAPLDEKVIEQLKSLGYLR
jgi:hypothetical protein